HPHRYPAAKAPTTPPHLYCDVQNLSLGNAHKFSLRMLHLIMQAPQNVAGGAGMIILHKVLDNSRVRQDPLVVALEEEATLIPKNPRFQDEHPGQRGRNCL